jgi:GcrA cell cycle regulator
MTMSWTEERIATLTRMWEGGATASQIAEELGGVSRNAVIGKAHRLGLKARPSPVKANEAKAAARPKDTAPSKQAGTRAKPPVEAPADESESAAIESAGSAGGAGESTAGGAATEESTRIAAPGVDKQTVSAAEPTVPAPPADTPAPAAPMPRIVSVGPGGFLRQGPGDQQAPIPPAPPRRLVPARPSPEIAGKTSLLDLNDRVCRWPMGHPGEPDFHFCGEKVNPGFPYCVEHCGRAYQAQLPRGARRPPPPLPFGGPRVR